MNKYWSKEEFEVVVKNSKTIREVLRYFGFPSNQGHYNKLFHKAVEEFKIDISHIIESAKNRQFKKKIPLEELLVNGSPRSTKTLKRRLLREKILEDKCSMCEQLPYWNNKILNMQLDHVNGDITDNRLENLRLLCPNCHSQTDTYGGRNSSKKHAYKHVCKMCGGTKKDTRSENCKQCTDKLQKENTKIEWPPKEKILRMVEELGFSATGRELGVSDNAVRKFLKRE